MGRLVSVQHHVYTSTYSTPGALDITLEASKSVNSAWLQIRGGLRWNSDFESLDDRFFSLGQDDSYYDHLNELVPDLKDEILNALRDLPYGESDRFEAALKEPVTTVSLLRSVAKGSVRNQFRRIALGGVRLSQYHFSYSAACYREIKEGRSLIFVRCTAGFTATNEYPCHHWAQRGWKDVSSECNVQSSGPLAR